MAAYRRVYDSCHLQAECQEPGSAPKPDARQSSIGHLYLLVTIIILLSAEAGVPNYESSPIDTDKSGRTKRRSIDAAAASDHPRRRSVITVIRRKTAPRNYAAADPTRAPTITRIILPQTKLEWKIISAGRGNGIRAISRIQHSSCALSTDSTAK